MSSTPLDPPLRTSILLGGRGVAGGVDGRGEPGSTWREAMMTGRVLPSGSGAGHRRDPAPILSAVLDLGVDEVLVRVEWARLTPTEGLMEVLVNCLQQRFTMHCYRPTSETWKQMGRTGRGMACELTVAIRLALVRLDNPTVTVKAFSQTTQIVVPTVPND